jgi:hypothetical protein
MMDFIVCNSKKSKPKVNVTVCGKCKRRRSCDDYSRYCQPLLFPDLAFLGDAKKPKKKRAYTKPAEPIKKQEQLGMEGILKQN